MALTDLNHMLEHAYRHGYALATFEVDDLAALQAVMTAAEETRAPVVLTPDTHADTDLLLPALEAAAERARIPVALQMGGVDSQETLARAIRLGCNAIRVDGGGNSFAQRVQTTQEIVATARSCGLAALADSGDPEGSTPAEARTFTERTEADALMIRSLPNNGSGKGGIDYTWIRQIHRAMERPLGVTTGRGVSTDQYRRLLSIGIAQVEHGKEAAAGTGEGKEGVAACLRACGAAGRAAEVLAQCASWQGTEHIILCDLSELEETRAQPLLSEGERILANLPGVRSAQAALSLTGSGPYRLAWRVRLCHRDALSAFHVEADPTSFASRFEAVTAGCLRIDLESRPAGTFSGDTRTPSEGGTQAARNVTPIHAEGRKTRA